MIRKLLQGRLFSARRLPDEIYCELVELMYMAVLPMIVMGVATFGLGSIIAEMSGALVSVALSVACLLITAVRVGLVYAYRQVRPVRDPAVARLWERRYAAGTFTFALALGLLDACALMRKDPLQHMMAVGLILTYGSGLVARMSVRPLICSISLGLAVLPTLAGLSIHFAGHGPLARAAYFSLFLLIMAVSLASLESIRHIYRTTLRHLLTRHELGQLARQDILTGLSNRLQLRESLEAELAMLAHGGRLLAVHALDLDQFKPVNDRFGHPTGDALLQAVAGRLRALVVREDLVARLGGDEFVVLQTGLRHMDEARLLGHRIARAIGAPYRIGGQDVRIGVSVGIALSPRDGKEATLLLACADQALYAAKREGRGRVVMTGEDVAGGSSQLPPGETKVVGR